MKQEMLMYQELSDEQLQGVCGGNTYLDEFEQYKKEHQDDKKDLNLLIIDYLKDKMNKDKNNNKLPK